MTSEEFESYVPVYDAVPSSWEDAREFFVERLKELSNAVNIRTIGWYLDEELLSGNQFIPSSNLTGSSEQFRTMLRKVVDFGPLPNTTIKAVPHGITFDQNFTLIKMYGAATSPAVLAIPIPYSAPTLNQNISLFMDATNIYIQTGIDWSAFTRCFVTIEYIQEL